MLSGLYIYIIMRNSKVIFNRQQLLKNLKSLGAENVCAMVKANAYGVGVKKVCTALLGKVKYFGVANMPEALEIRTFDKTTPILVVGISSDFDNAILNNIDLTIESVEMLLILQKYIKNTNKKIKIHLKINTGMNRLGLDTINEFKVCLKIIQKSPNIVLAGVFTHFATINEDNIFLQKQIKKFKQFCNIIPPIFNPIIHIGGGSIVKKINITKHPEIMVRAGLELYRHTIKIESKIIKIRNIKKGDRVGYSNGFVADKNYEIGIIPLGYADGINRKLSNLGYVKLGKQHCKIIGNICMDMFFIDLTNKNAKLGDTVQIFWDEDHWAQTLDTIPYEILTNLRVRGN